MLVSPNNTFSISEINASAKYYLNAPSLIFVSKNQQISQIWIFVYSWDNLHQTRHLLSSSKPQNHEIHSVIWNLFLCNVHLISFSYHHWFTWVFQPNDRWIDKIPVIDVSRSTNNDSVVNYQQFWMYINKFSNWIST